MSLNNVYSSKVSLLAFIHKLLKENSVLSKSKITNFTFLAITHTPFKMYEDCFKIWYKLPLPAKISRSLKLL